MAKICIGIISYLPSKWGLRLDRIVRLTTLLSNLTKLFDLPIIIIAQNYKQEDKDKLLNYTSNITFIDSEPLGITGARERLRQEFLKTNYTDMILLDDDCDIRGDKETADNYLSQIEANSGKLGIFAKSLHKLLVLGKDAAKLLAYDLENTPEKHLCYEDRLALWKFVGKNPKMFYRFTFYKNGPHNLQDTSVANHDKRSSWSSGLDQKTINEMSDRTDNAIEKATGMKIEDVYKLAGYEYHKNAAK